MTWEILQTVSRLAVTALTIVALTRYRHMFIRIERLGLGFMGGCGILTIGVIWEQDHSPFSGWIPTLFTLGAALFLGGLLHRKGKHENANATAVEEARRHLIERGKL